MIGDQCPVTSDRWPVRLCLARTLVVLSLAFTLTGCAAENARPQFEGEKAFAMLKRQCDFGPRPPGTAEHFKTRDFLLGELKKHSDRVALQSFNHAHSTSGEKLDMSNVIASFGPTEGREILLCAHWDTRPTADEELDAEKRRQPIIGANDGASGVAVLLELARMFKVQPPKVPVTIVLFDGEDYGPTGDDMYLGAKYFASKLEKPENVRYCILLDMVGDKDLNIYRERHSNGSAPEIVAKVWRAARKLGYGKFFIDEPKYAITDDHIPLIKRGIPCIDVIDFDYAYWHTHEDTVSRCGAESLRIVGETVAEVVYSEQASPRD